MTHKLPLATTLALAALAATPLTLSAAPLSNADFSQGFTAWQGVIDDGVPATVAPADHGGNFALSATPGFATLTNDATYYGVTLFQPFDLSAAGAAGISLSFDFSWSKTSGLLDGVSASLLDDVGNPLLDLFPAGLDTTLPTNSGSTTADLSAYAAQSVMLAFQLSDGDFNEQDRFTVGSITLDTGDVPLAPTGALLLAGLTLLPLVRRRR